MSAEAIQLASSMKRNSIDMQIALQCAPLLTGIKISNILITDHKNEFIVKQLFENSLLSAKIIYQSDEKIIFFIFHEDKLFDYLTGTEETALLKILGYNQMDIQEIINEFSRRFTGYMEEKKNFPHELGLLLEYPVEDVVGFIDNQGKNYLYIGYWKVYGNLQQALETFRRYKSAKEKVARMVVHGVSIERILDAYHPKNKQLAM